MPLEEIIAALSRFAPDAMNDAGENRMQLAMGVTNCPDALMPVYHISRAQCGECAQVAVGFDAIYSRRGS